MSDLIGGRSDDDLRSLASAMCAYQRLMDAVGEVSSRGVVLPPEAASRVNGDIIERNAARARERELPSG